MKNTKHKASSISTDVCMAKVEARILGNSGVLTSEDLEYDPKKDAEMLNLGVRPDGGPQIAAKKVKNRFKSTELDLGKYMSHGYSGTVPNTKEIKK